jgi:hypothetical protein
MGRDPFAGGPIVRSHLKRNCWTISGVERETTTGIGASCAPPSTRYEPRYVSSSRHERSRGATITPLPRTKTASVIAALEGRPSSPPKPKNKTRVADVINAMTPAMLLNPNVGSPARKTGLADASATKSCDLLRWGDNKACKISKTRRDTTFVRSSAVGDASGAYYRDDFGSCIGGRMSPTVRFRAAAASTTPGPGEYSDMGAPTTNVKGTCFSRPSGPRAALHARDQVPGPGAYPRPSDFDATHHHMSAATASFLAAHIPFDPSQADAALMSDIKLIRSTARTIARNDLRA